jgi:protein TonB
MFDASLSVSRFPVQRSGRGTLLSVAAHAVVIAVMLRASAHMAEKKAEPPGLVVHFASAPPPPPPPGGPAAPHAEPKHEQVQVKHDPLALRPTVEHKTPPAQAPDPPPGVEGGEVGGKEGGEVGGTGTVLAPAASSPPPTNIVLSFGEGMNRPERISGPEPVYPREAREAKVEGTMLVQCVITTEGVLQGCRVLKSLPFMDQPVLAALAQQRYSPVTFQGRPVAVRYVIPFKFKLQ